jgi:malate dehydrogenase
MLIDSHFVGIEHDSHDICGTKNSPRKPAAIAITGAGGQIGYSLLFRLATGELLGCAQPLSLRLLTPNPRGLDAILMELADCAYPLLHEIVVTDNPWVAFKNVDYAFLVGAKPRRHGMLRRDLLLENAEIFREQGKALNDVASRNVKILVVGNPANTNTLIAMKNAPDLAPECFSSMAMLDHNRAVGKLAEKCGVPAGKIQRVSVWGNHSCMQYPDIHHAKVNGIGALSLVDKSWFVDEFIPKVQHRGMEVIKERGQSSAASAANAAIKQMSAWIYGTQENDWISMGVASDGSYGISEGLIYSYPVTISNGRYRIVNDLALNEFGEDMLRKNEMELADEMDAIRHLLG